MKTKVNRVAFLSALNKVKPGLSGSAIIEQSGAFVFRGNRVYTFNDEISAHAPLEAELPECAVPAEELHKLLDRTEVEVVELEFTEEELKVRTNRMNAGIRLDRTITLPIDEIKPPKKYSSIPDGFFEGLQYCIPCVSKNHNNPVLTCVNVNQAGIVEACDNFRLMRYTMDTSKAKEFQPFLLPASSAKELLKYPSLSQYGISPDKNWIQFREEHGLHLSCRTYLNMNYPDLEGILDRINKDKKQENIKFPGNVDSIIERVSVFLSTDPLDEVIEINLKDGSIEMEGRGQTGWCRERCRIEYKSAPVSFLINPRNFKEILKQMNEGAVGETTVRFRSKNIDHVIWINRVKEEKTRAKNN